LLSSKSLLSHNKAFINAFMQSFLGRTSTRMQRNFVNSNSCYVSGKMRRNTDRQESPTPLLWLPEWRPGQELGPAHVLQNLCGKSYKMYGWQKANSAFCRTHGVKREDGG
jgi:hypothetical protein